MLADTSGTTEATGTNVNIDGAETASDAVTLKELDTLTSILEEVVMSRLKPLL